MQRGIRSSFKYILFPIKIISNISTLKIINYINALLKPFLTLLKDKLKPIELKIKQRKNAYNTPFFIANKMQKNKPFSRSYKV